MKQIKNRTERRSDWSGAIAGYAGIQWPDTRLLTILSYNIHNMKSYIAEQTGFHTLFTQQIRIFYLQTWKHTYPADIL